MFLDRFVPVIDLGLRSLRSLRPTHNAWAEPTGERHIRTHALLKSVQFLVSIDISDSRIHS